ncbi:MAG: WYL domain-containing protein [Leptospiraceae bacterium]|nr:WYL domain-containing protein [Leptospiraceae bacterium]
MAKAQRQNLSPEQQILMGIEQLAFSSLYVFNDRTNLTAQDMIDFLYYMQQSPQELLAEGSGKKASAKKSKLKSLDGDAFNNYQRTFLNYRRMLSEIYHITIDFKRNLIDGLNNHQKEYRQMCHDYLKSFSFNFDYNALNIWLDREQGRFEVLQRLFILKYFIKFGMLFSFDYEKLMSSTQTNRKIIPVAVTSRNGYLDVIGYEDGTDELKYYILSCISKIHSDLWDEFFKGKWNHDKTSSFNLQHFEENSPNARFQKPIQRYVFKLSGNSMHHFRNTFNIQYDILDQENDNEYVTIAFESADERFVKALMFDYGDWCRLLEPQSLVKSFNEKLAALTKHYKKK